MSLHGVQRPAITRHHPLADATHHTHSAKPLSMCTVRVYTILHLLRCAARVRLRIFAVRFAPHSRSAAKATERTQRKRWRYGRDATLSASACVLVGGSIVVIRAVCRVAGVVVVNVVLPFELRCECEKLSKFTECAKQTGIYITSQNPKPSTHRCTTSKRFSVKN